LRIVAAPVASVRDGIQRVERRGDVTKEENNITAYGRAAKPEARPTLRRDERMICVRAASNPRPMTRWDGASRIKISR
jgi:hypothetical protein